MVSRKHGGIVSWVVLEKMKNSLSNLCIEKALYEDGTYGINIYQNPYGSIHKPISLDYPCIKAIILGLAELHGKEEVERELGVKIK